MKHSTTAAALALAVAAALTLSACSTSGSGGSDSKAGAKLKIGVAIPAGNEVYWTGFENGAKSEAKKEGVDVTFTDASNDAQTQNDQINTLVVSGVKGIAIASVDSDANKSVAQAASDANIPLITSNRTLNISYGGIGGKDPLVHTGFDDTSIGQEQAQLVIKACQDLNPCNVLQEVGTLGSSPQIDREKGLEAGIKGHDNIKILATQANDFDPTKAIDVTQSLLQAHANANIITTQEDPSAIAVVKVLKEQGLSGKIQVIGIGGSKDGVNAVADGSMYGTVQVSSHLDGSTAVKTLVAIIKKQKVQVKTIDGRPTVVVPSAIVTKDNAADHPGDW